MSAEEHSRSLWANVEVRHEAPLLDRDERADVVVIGAGIAGLSAAYELQRKGLGVVVVDRAAIGGVMTARTTAHLASDSDDGFDTLIKVHGLDGARTFHASHAAAIDRIAQILDEEKIDCDFRRLDGYLFPGPNTQPKDLDPEYDAARRIGMPVERARGLPFEGLTDVGCLRYPKQARFHPLRYLRGVAGALASRGARLHAGTAVMEVGEQDGAVTVKTANGRTISAGAAVVAANSPIADRVALHSKQAPYRSYAIALTIPKDTIEDALYWDTLDPYHYVRLQPGPGAIDELIVGGGDHKTGEANDAQARLEGLESWARALIPTLGKVTHRWSGQVLEPIDAAAFSGRNPGSERVFVHTGDSGQGITHGVLGGMLLAELITGGTSAWAAFYDPARKASSAAGQFISENLTAAKNLAEYVTPGELASFDVLAPGHGAIVRSGLSKVAAYRDENGRLITRSAACTHLGCHVHWNAFERCWDCPCHGSHFAPDGTVLNGPAVTPLPPVK
jgi:glycine/D-amino acid oxidase-like deaminating enzyme/nitrite reductase/ring-hydroxylating ferredoxin subunit